MRKYKLLLLDILITTLGISGVFPASHVFEELEHFLNDNGHRYVDLIYNVSSAQSKWLAFVPKSISVARLKIGDVFQAKQQAFGIFLFDDEMDDTQAILRVIVQRKIKMSLLLYTTPIREGELALEKQLKILNAVGLFYTFL